MARGRHATQHATACLLLPQVIEDMAADNVVYAEIRTTPKVLFCLRLPHWPARGMGMRHDTE